MSTPDSAVLALNAGSSSMKFALFRRQDGDPAVLSRGAIENIRDAPRFTAKDAGGAVIKEQTWPGGAAPSSEALLGTLLDWAQSQLGGAGLASAGHRVVHGGPEHFEPARVTDGLLAALDRLTPLAPLHQPHSLAPIHAIATLWPGLPQVACFDTGFHHAMPPVATRYALPPEYAAIRRYGFHGLSYEHIARTLRRTAPGLAAGRVIVAHLGNGASLCAMQDGRSVDTTMGFTALDGLVMGTRCGSIDPGALLYLQQAHGMTADQLGDLLYHRCGLLGVSGVSSDMRAVLASADPAARDAVELFTYRIAREAGALASSLGGVDGLVFTAGIGEHTPGVRAAVCERLGWLGITLDEAANARGAGRISAERSRVEVLVIPTDEEATIARQTIGVTG